MDGARIALADKVLGGKGAAELRVLIDGIDRWGRLAGDKAMTIKGYSGQVLVDANVWLHDERRIDNPLAKANQISRIYASRIRENLAPGERSGRASCRERV